MTSFLDTTINKYKQLLVNFGYDKLNAGVFVIVEMSAEYQDCSRRDWRNSKNLQWRKPN